MKTKTNKNKKEELLVSKKQKKEKQSAKSQFKRFFYGVGKEFERTSWTKKQELTYSFFITLIVLFVLALIFTAIAIGINQIR